MTNCRKTAIRHLFTVEHAYSKLGSASGAIEAQARSEAVAALVIDLLGLDCSVSQLRGSARSAVFTFERLVRQGWLLDAALRTGYTTLDMLVATWEGTEAEAPSEAVGLHQAVSAHPSARRGFSGLSEASQEAHEGDLSELRRFVRRWGQ